MSDLELDVVGSCDPPKLPEGASDNGIHGPARVDGCYCGLVVAEDEDCGTGELESWEPEARRFQHSRLEMERPGPGCGPGSGVCRMPDLSEGRHLPAGVHVDDMLGSGGLDEGDSVELAQETDKPTKICSGGWAEGDGAGMLGVRVSRSLEMKTLAPVGNFCRGNSGTS